MGFRVVQQPNMLYGVYSDVVDDFTFYNMTFREMVTCLHNFYGMDEDKAVEKIKRGVDELATRYDTEIENVRIMQGEERAQKLRDAMNTSILDLTAAEE